MIYKGVCDAKVDKCMVDVTGRRVMLVAHIPTTTGAVAGDKNLCPPVWGPIMSQNGGGIKCRMAIYPPGLMNKFHPK